MAARPCLISMISKRMSLVAMRPSGSYTPSGGVTPMSPSANMVAETALVEAIMAGPEGGDGLGGMATDIMLKSAT